MTQTNDRKYDATLDILRLVDILLLSESFNDCTACASHAVKQLGFQSSAGVQHAAYVVVCATRTKVVTITFARTRREKSTLTFGAWKKYEIRIS
eukprot:1162829-Prorocentrum_minimum.AAC.3